MRISKEHDSFPSIMQNFQRQGIPRKLTIDGVEYLREGEIGDIEIVFITNDAPAKTIEEAYSQTSTPQQDAPVVIDEEAAADLPQVSRRRKIKG